MKKYVVLKPISPQDGPTLYPAGHRLNKSDEPLVVDEATLFPLPNEFSTNDQRAAILIAMGAIALYTKHDKGVDTDGSNN